jgi:hypothetical protein
MVATEVPSHGRKAERGGLRKKLVKLKVMATEVPY